MGDKEPETNPSEEAGNCLSNRPASSSTRPVYNEMLEENGEDSSAMLFFPRVRTPCGHGAQVIVEGREEQSDGGERNRETQHHTKQTKHHNPGPTGRASTIM